METLEEFYRHKFNQYPENLHNTIGQFNVFRIENRMRVNEELPSHVRRNFFKIMLFSGKNIFKFGNEEIKISGNTLVLHPESVGAYMRLQNLQYTDCPKHWQTI